MTARYVLGRVIGRMPDPRNLRLAPSRSYPWYGHWGDGDRLSGSQLLQLDERGLSAATVEIVEVRREATREEMWWPTGSPPPLYAFHCPVLARRADGGVRVIAPSGEAKLVRPAPLTSIATRSGR